MANSKWNLALSPGKENMIKIGIVVLNYNGLENTLECLDSLKRIDKKGFNSEIIVVDNASTDGSAEALSKVKGIHLINNLTNLGFCGGNNIGIKEALKRGASHVLILNNDVIVKEDFLSNLLKTKADITSPKIYFAAGFEFHKSRYKKESLGKIIWYAGAKIDWQNIIGIHIGVDEVDHGQFSKSHQIDLATGACMLVKREVFEKIGYFDEKYFLYLEDMDFCVRAKKAHFKILFQPHATIWHKNATSTGGSGSSLQDYFITRNRLLFAAKYAKLRTKIAVFKQIAAQFQDTIKRKALIDFLMFNFGQGSFHEK